MTKLKDKIVGYISPKQRRINTLENKVSTHEDLIKQYFEERNINIYGK